MDTQQSSESSNIRLHYFGLNARASFIRAILHYKQLDFEDKRYDFQAWGSLKKSGDFEFEQMPMLEIDGHKLSQTSAICFYLARKYDLLGSNLYEEYLVNSLLGSYEDYIPKLVPILFPRTEEQKANLDKNTQDFLNVNAPFFLKRWEARFNANGKDYMVGDRFSLADIFICVNLFISFKQPNRKEIWEPVLNEHAPNLSKHVDKIVQNELSNYFAKGYISEASF
jgi:glutathione S-transferase